MSVTYAPRHRTPPRLTPILLAGLDAAVLAVAILAVVLAALAFTRAARVTTASPLPTASTTAPVHATPSPVTPHRAAQSRPEPVLRHYTVRAGDSLWKISARAYGTGYGWDRIYTANRTTVGPNPDVIQAGQQLTVPRT